MNKKRNLILIMAIVFFGLLLVGGTYAFLSFSEVTINGDMNGLSTCFIVDNDYTNDDGTSKISGTLFQSSRPKGGLYGKTSMKVNSDCAPSGIGSVYITAKSGTDSILYQKVVDYCRNPKTNLPMTGTSYDTSSECTSAGYNWISGAHCENPTTLETMKSYTTSSSCSSAGGTWVASGEHSALKYAVYEDLDSDPVAVGHIDGTDRILMYDDIKLSRSYKSVYVYVWLDGNFADNRYLNVSFNGGVSLSAIQTGSGVSYKEAILNGADPVLDKGMLPVIISSTGVVTTADISREWYSYENKQWANMVLVKEEATSGVADSKSREYYLSNAGVPVLESDILAYYVWIPRYKYKIWISNANNSSSPQTIDVVFEGKGTEKSNGTVVNQYLTHPAFLFGETDVSGFWVGKFELTGSSSTPTIKPNLSSLRNQNLSSHFVTTLKFSGGSFNSSTGEVTFSGSTYYGLTNNVDSHMVKNSEWGAIAYLSHSEYGINREIYINNSSSYITGRSGGNVGGSQKTLANQFSGSSSSTDKYNSYGYYNWIGQPVSISGTLLEVGDATLGTYASTTGNITGIYDISGGGYEYALGNYGNNLGNSGFTVFPNKKYYNSYSSSIFTGNYSNNMKLCTIEICGGHALFETANWYSDYAYFVYSNSVWFGRGGYYDSGASAGMFITDVHDGSSDEYTTTRSILVVNE